MNGSGNSAADQIPLLLKMNEDELALQKVIFSLMSGWMINMPEVNSSSKRHSVRVFLDQCSALYSILFFILTRAYIHTL